MRKIAIGAYEKLNIAKIGKNPFRIMFVGIGVICCVVLGVAFYYVSYLNDRATQQKYTTEYAELLMRDFEMQLELMDEIAVQVASNYKLHPYYFQDSITKEQAMLQTLKQYRYYLTLSDEYFYYYGTERVYRSTGSTLAYDLFIKSRSDIEEEQQYLISKIANMLEIKNAKTNLETFAIGDDLYILIPIRVRIDNQMKTAVVGFVMKKSALNERFAMLTGGTAGHIVLYRDENILYSESGEDGYRKGTEVCITSSDGHYTLYYSAEKQAIENGYLLLQLLLILTDILLILVIANLFAQKAYRPIEAMNGKYRKNESEEKFNNGLEELNSILENMQKSNVFAERELEKNHKILREQILRMLLENVNVTEIVAHLRKEEIHLEGPFYCVVSICFDEQLNVTDEFLEILCSNLEELSYDNNYIYAICNPKKKLINVICSIYVEEGKDELLEVIFEVAQGYDMVPVIGVGNVYRNIQRISASALESMDDIYIQKENKEKKNEPYTYHSEEIRKIVVALESGDEQLALQKLDEYLEKLRERPMSLLVQQCIMADFCSEVKQLGQKQKLILSKQNIGLLISAKNIEMLEAALKNIISEFCSGYEKAKNQVKDEKSITICQYINEHFMEYDFSLEGVAVALHVTTGIVRQAVFENMGKGYKDYVIFLRIEYAKELLRETELSVAVVCEKVGYGNISYFIKLFKETTGMTPAKFRKEIV